MSRQRFPHRWCEHGEPSVERRDSLRWIATPFAFAPLFARACKHHACGTQIRATALIMEWQHDEQHDSAHDTHYGSSRAFAGVTAGAAVIAETDIGEPPVVGAQYGQWPDGAAAQPS
jgi:hypothetical protein